MVARHGVSIYTHRFGHTNARHPSVLFKSMKSMPTAQKLAGMTRTRDLKPKQMGVNSRVMPMPTDGLTSPVEGY